MKLKDIFSLKKKVKEGQTYFLNGAGLLQKELNANLMF